MSYFRNVEFVPYKFGDQNQVSFHQNLTAYVDIVDTIKNNSSFYQKYTILPGDRPDNLSQLFYNNPKYYWTFFLLNDKLREQGWPLDDYKILELVQAERNNTTLITRADITSKFKVGSTVTGSTSGVSGTVIKRRLEYGQIIIRGLKDFSPVENISATENDVVNIATLVGATEQYNSVHHYEDADGLWVDINPYNGPGVQDVAVSYYDRYVVENDALKDIVVIKPDVIDTIFERHQQAMANN